MNAIDEAGVDFSEDANQRLDHKYFTTLQNKKKTRD